jgi:AcrR family transcriptional regulator
MNIIRKQQEFHKREEKILNLSADILAKGGFNALTMDKVAQKMQYSKGTIYKHFANKEEIIASLGINCAQRMLSFFERAVGFDGNTREKMLAIFFAYQLNNKLNPTDFKNMQVLKSSPILTKITDKNIQAIKESEIATFTFVTNLIQEAIDKKELATNKNMTPEDIVYAIWSQVYGSSLLMETEIDWKSLKIRSTNDTTLNIINQLLDSLEWLPLTKDINYQKIMDKLRYDIFTEEYNSLSV